jgi:formylglycine-generating enzyme required for sulfatase activity
MIQIPDGVFLMGCDSKVDSCRRDRTHIEEPLHPVYLDAYEIDKYEVTNLEYRKCVAAKACQLPRRFNSKRRDAYFNNANYNYYPVMFVSWWDAQNYCQWQGKRLPTEAEWEKAARGAIDTRPWPWGNEPHDCSRANYRVHCKPGDSTQVGAYPTGASPYGLMDMSGNVFEWVQDVYDVGYCSYTDNWWYSRVAHRHWGHHGDKPSQDAFLFRNYRVGFRCARSLTE